MTTLAAELLRHRAAPIDAVENAMLRQSLYGGDLATNLLELAAIDESNLLAQLALTFELEMVKSGPLPEASDELKRILPGDVGSRHGIFPLGFEMGDLLVAVSVPLMSNTIEDLAFSLGHELRQRIALDVRIRQALSRDYRLPLSERFVRLSLSMDSGQPLNLSIPPPRASARAFPIQREPASGEASTGTVPTLVSSRASFFPQFAAPVAQSIANKAIRRFGPFTASMMEKELQSAKTAKEVLRIWLDYSAQYFEYSAVFTVQGDIACGLESRGLSSASESLSHVGIPLEFPSVLSEARRTARWILAKLSAEGIDATLARDLRRSSGKSVMVAPVMLRDRAVALLYGDHGDADVQLSQVGEFISVVPIVERSMGRVLMTRKREHASEAPEMSRSLPPISTKAEARERVSAPPRFYEQPQSSLGALPSQPQSALGALPSQPILAANAPQTSESESKAKSRNWELARPIVDIETPPPGPEHLAAASDLSSTSGAYRSFSLPKIPVTETQAPAPQTERSGEATQSTAPQPDISLPRIDTDYENKSLAIIDRLLEGNSDAISELLAFGDAGASVLVRELPGPIVIPTRAVRPDLGPIRASECGPLLRAMAAFGPTARPYVIARTADADPRVRQWTTRLLGELPGRQSAMAVAQRLMHDRDAEVRRAAFAAGQLLAHDTDSALALRNSLSGAARNETLAVTQRLAAIDALSDLRDGLATPSLWRLLHDVNPSIAAAAQQALVVLACRDFGHDVEAWSHWWDRNGTRHRVEWLIDALTDDSPNVRQSATEQLRQISRLYVGHYDDSLLEERSRVQERYRTWWDTTGRAAVMAEQPQSVETRES
jgi:hypothetical protein